MAGARLAAHLPDFFFPPLADFFAPPFERDIEIETLPPPSALKLPGTPPEFVKADRNPMPPPDATPYIPALRNLVQREYRGFQLPPALR